MASGMTIEHGAVRAAPITGERVWTGADTHDLSAWTYRFSPSVLEELDQVVQTFVASGRTVEALLRGEVAERDFPHLTSFHADAQWLGEQIRGGSGFALLKGFPTERYSFEESRIAYARICSYFGEFLPQNREGALTYSVRNEGFELAEHGTPGVNGAKSTARLYFHTDSAPAYGGFTPDTVALLCLHPAESGGISLLANGNTLHNAMRVERPECLQRAYAPYHFDRRSETLPGEAPTLWAPIFEYGDELRVRFNYFYLVMGYDAAGEILTPRDRAPIQFIRTAAERDGFALQMALEQGDIQLINNRWLLHSRTAYTDSRDPARQRHLLRLWLKYPSDSLRA